MKKLDRAGMIGLGVMGLPIARRLCEAGQELKVWNRSSSALTMARQFGAEPLRSPAAVIESSRITLLMLANECALDAALGRAGDTISAPVADRTLIQLGTTSPAYSDKLSALVSRLGGRYVEAPVSGSRIPAERGELVGMLGASDEAGFALAESILRPITQATFRCGAPPAAMRMKLAVNCYLVITMLGLAEAWEMAGAVGADRGVFRDILDSGPMASAVSRGKLAKLTADDMSPQASIEDVRMNANLIAAEARHAGVPAPLIGQCLKMLEGASAAGLGPLDVIAVRRRKFDSEPRARKAYEGH